jgi:hypothetical protein
MVPVHWSQFIDCSLDEHVKTSFFEREYVKRTARAMMRQFHIEVLVSLGQAFQPSDGFMLPWCAGGLCVSGDEQ